MQRNYDKLATLREQKLCYLSISKWFCIRFILTVMINVNHFQYADGCKVSPTVFQCFLASALGHTINSSQFSDVIAPSYVIFLVI